MNRESNIILIGMPGAGKSTIGVLLAKALGRHFLDTDVYIQALEGRRLQEIIDTQGLEVFRRIEEQHLLCIDRTHSVIATGGSAIYSEKAMEHFKTGGVVVHLNLPLAEIEKRITDLATRGVVMEPNESLSSLYEKRLPLYQKWADISVDCAHETHQQTLRVLLEALDQN